MKLFIREESRGIIGYIIADSKRAACEKLGFDTEQNRVLGWYDIGDTEVDFLHVEDIFYGPPADHLFVNPHPEISSRKDLEERLMSLTPPGLGYFG